MRRKVKNDQIPVAPPAQMHYYPPPQMYYRQKKASAAWFLIGLLFGPIGVLVAFASDNHDGRTRKALQGWALWLAFICALWMFVSVWLSGAGVYVFDLF